jgi:hypothetical protein
VRKQTQEYTHPAARLTGTLRSHYRGWLSGYSVSVCRVALDYAVELSSQAWGGAVVAVGSRSALSLNILGTTGTERRICITVIAFIPEEIPAIADLLDTEQSFEQLWAGPLSSQWRVRDGRLIPDDLPAPE